MVQPVPTEQDARWRAVLARDGEADGAFVFAVRTTGVYCRPSCGARRPRPENVCFFADGSAARAAGFRACRRCAPDAARGDAAQRTRLVAELCRRLAAAEAPLPLAELARTAGYSPFWLQRVFTAAVGCSPRAFQAAHRAERLRRELAAGATVTAAMHRAGYGSTSRLHAVGERALGMRPARARDGGAGERIEHAVVDCSLGRALCAATSRGLCAILLGDDDAALREDLRRRFPNAQLAAGSRRFVRHLRRVVACLDGERTDPGLPLDLRGTAFQQRVWAALRGIAPGRTADYAAVAARLGAPGSARAVARACGDNPLAVVVPCHRVVRRDGALAGYRWGLARKQALLAREGAPAGTRGGRQ